MTINRAGRPGGFGPGTRRPGSFAPGTRGPGPFGPGIISAVTTAAAIVGASLVWAYGHVVRDLVHDWVADGNYSHGFFIVPFAAWVAWDRRRDLAAAAIRPHLAGAVVVVFSLACFAAGTLAVEQFVTRLSLVGVLAGTVLFVCGPVHLRLLAFPLLLLILAIPLPAIVMNQIALPLQAVTARGAAALLTLASVPVLREGNALLLPRTALEVEQACSGLRSIVSLITIGVVAGYLSRRGLVARFCLTALTVPVAVVASAVRVAVLGVAAHYYAVDINHSPLHGFTGFAVFMTTCALVFVVDSRIMPARRIARLEFEAC